MNRLSPVAPLKDEPFDAFIDRLSNANNLHYLSPDALCKPAYRLSNQPKPPTPQKTQGSSFNGPKLKL